MGAFSYSLEASEVSHRVRKALLMLLGLKKHDLCFLVTLSRIGEYVELYDYGDELL